MSGPNVGWSGCGKVLVAVLVFAIVIILAMPSWLLAIGPIGDPEPAPPVRIPGSGDPPPIDPGDEGEGVAAFLLTIGPIGDPEPAPPVGIPWPEEDPPSAPEDEEDEETPGSVMPHLA